MQLSKSNPIGQVNSVCFDAAFTNAHRKNNAETEKAMLGFFGGFL